MFPFSFSCYRSTLGSYFLVDKHLRLINTEKLGEQGRCGLREIDIVGVGLCRTIMA